MRRESVTGLIQGLNAFHNDFNNHRELFEQLSTGQSPEVLFITCPIPALILVFTQAQPGDLFVMRNVGISFLHMERLIALKGQGLNMVCRWALKISSSVDIRTVGR